MDQTQQQQLEQVLRRLLVGLKTFQLYPPSHPSSQVTVQDITASLRGYLQRYGAFALQVSKDKVLVDGITLSDGGMQALAFFLYVRNLASIGIRPGVADHEVGAVLSLLSQDRQAIESSGGLEHLASSQDLPHIIVKTMTLKESVDALSEAGIVDALTRTRRLSPEQREVVFSVLRNGPAATAALLMTVHNAPGGTSADGSQVDVDHILIALETLDRAILDDPVKDQEGLMQSVAQGVLQLDEGIRGALAPELLSRAVEGGSGPAILSELTGQEIALFMLGPAGQSEVATRLSKFLADLRLPEDRAAEVTAFLETALAAGRKKLGLMTAWQGGAQRPPDRSERDVWTDIDPSLTMLDPRDEAALDVLRREVSEHTVTRDAVKALINLLRLQERPEEVADTAKILATHLQFLTDHQEYDLLILALQLVQEARTRVDVQRPILDAELTRVLNAGLLEHLVHFALQPSADAPDGVLQGLVAIRNHAAPYLIKLLDREPVDTVRLRLCKLLVDVCAGQPDLIGVHLPGASWHLARNLAVVLGDLRDPAAVRHLAILAVHSEYRVRREALEAVRKIPTGEARAALLKFLDDPDPRVQYALVEGVGAEYDARIADWLQRAMRSPNWTPGAVDVKVAAMRALARMRAEDALPLLRRIARARLVFGQGRRTLRDAARQILATWEGSRPRRP